MHYNKQHNIQYYNQLLNQYYLEYIVVVFI